MKTILYIQGQYIDSLNELRKIFQGPISENLRRDILSVFQDGVLSNWLKEGDEECLSVLKKISAIDMSLSNQSHIEELTAVFTDKRTAFSCDSSILKFDDHCQIEEVTYCKLDDKNNPIGEPLKIDKKGIRFKKEERLAFQLYIGVKITNPDKESLTIDLSVRNKTDILFTEKEVVSLYTKKNDVQYKIFNVYLEETHPKTYEILLNFCEVCIWNAKIFIGIPSVNITIKGEKVAFCYVEGDEAIKSFYMMKYVVEKDEQPVVYMSYNNIRAYIQSIDIQEKINLRLPSVKEWRYAAKGGIYKETYTYAGSNKIDEVAWYCGNLGRNQWGTKKIGKKKPNILGLYDLCGNVWEMTEDIDEKSQTRRIICGGCYNAEAEKCKINSVSSIGRANDCNSETGFRLVFDADNIENLDDSVISFDE